MRMKPYAYGLLVLVIFFGVTGGAKAMGYWSVTGKVDPKTGETIQLTGANPEDIKGWMTVGDVSKAYGIPVGAILEAFGLPKDHVNQETALKDIETVVADEKLERSFSVQALRDWVVKQMAATK